MRHPPGYWKYSYENCYEEAKKYKSRNEFKHKSNSAYNAAGTNGWINDYYWMLPKFEKWTYEKCYNIAKNFILKKDFYKFNKRAYNASKTYHWLESFDWLLDGRYYNSDGSKKEKSKRKLNKILFSKIKSHCIYSYEFEDNSVYVGLTLIRRIEFRDFEHNCFLDTVSQYAIDHNIQIPKIKIVLTNLTPLEARIKEGEVLEDYIKNGWTPINKAKTGSLGSYGCSIWTKELCIEEAKRYKSINAYQKGNQASYAAAKRNGWLYEFDWFEHKFHPSGYWDYDHCYEEAKKYTLYNDFRSKSQTAYNSAKAHNWIEDYTWLKRQLRHPEYYTYERCYEEAKKYKTRGELIKNCGPVWKTANKNCWLDDYTWMKVIPSTTGKKAINNGIIGKKVYPEELEKYLNEGWKLGPLRKKKK